MKLSTLSALATLMGSMALPMLVPAQGPGLDRGRSPSDRSSERDKGRRDGDRGKRDDKGRDDRRKADKRGDDKRRDEQRRRDEENRRRAEENRRRVEAERRRIEEARRRNDDNRRDNDRWDNDRRDGDWQDGAWRNSGGQNGSWRDDNRNGGTRESDRRQDTKNEWRNIAYAAGAVTVLGLLKKDNTLTFAGAAGALYSLNRYEQDRRSQNSFNRARAGYFDRPYFVRDGVRYDRKSVSRNGERYYQFVRSR